jgi:hypothetical protein
MVDGKGDAWRATMIANRNREVLMATVLAQ